MHKKILLFYTLLVFCVVSAESQNPKGSFQQFRQKILRDYSDFKSRILDHYADFLNGEWHEFEPILTPESQYAEEKPRQLPEFVETDGSETNALSEFNPTAQISNQALPAITDSVAKPINPLLEGRETPRSNFEHAVLGIPDPAFIFGSLPGQKPLPFPGDCGVLAEGEKLDLDFNKFFFDFYGMNAYVVDSPFEILPEFEGINDTGTHWTMLAAQKWSQETARQLFGLADQMGLNGYLTFRLTEQFVRQKFPDATVNGQMSAVHFLLSQMGYDVRLVMANDLLTVMMPFDQKVVYASVYLQGENGRKYTVLYPEGYGRKRGEPLSLRSCAIPTEALGKTSDLRIAGLKLPMKAKEFSISNSRLSLHGVVNENLSRLLYRYPQMPNGDFASSWLDKGLRDSLVAQVREQLSGMERRDATNILLNLCHYSFNYKTDQEWHGFEKPYFLEENFLYDYNDCEDRAMFMSYLVWNAFNMPCQLIQYPGHESVAVAVDEEVRGRYYSTDGMRFYSSDPTYKGSRIGYVMPPYEDTAPSIDKLYK